jgi:hypothetical protein
VVVVARYKFQPVQMRELPVLQLQLLLRSISYSIRGLRLKLLLA